MITQRGVQQLLTSINICKKIIHLSKMSNILACVMKSQNKF